MGPPPFLNIDLGELPGETEDLYAHAHLANIACGGHAGDLASMRRALLACRRAGTRVSAHPSYPDRPNFGRRSMPLAPAELRRVLGQQLATLAALAAELRIELEAVKPHGALYHDADRDESVAQLLVEVVGEGLGEEVAIIAGPDGAMAAASAKAGVRHLREGFADRGVGPDGALLPRDRPGALILDPVLAAARATALAASGRYDTFCVHGDTEGAVEIARAVRQALDLLALEALA